MRFLIVAFSALAMSMPLAAQRPRVSPHETHDFVLDGSHISIDYGRPSKRGRAIWGGLVPWNRWWMPGADEATIITTEHPLVLGGSLSVPAGRHTLYMLPSEDAPKLIVNNQVGQFHTSYTPSRDLGRIDLTLTRLTESVEQLTFKVTPVASGGGRLELVWDDRDYSVSVMVQK